MKKAKPLCILMACLMLLACCTSGVGAAAEDDYTAVASQFRASGRFSLSVQANSYSIASSSFSLEKNAVISIDATCAPVDADVDCGVVDENGTFYGVSAKSGTISGSIGIKASGTYTLAVVNHSSSRVDVAGIVRY